MVNLGKITLNISFILYLVLYLPQLWRNIKYKHIKDLSFGFHALLFITATADLYYGFGRIEQWQYRAVSIVMFACLLTQHIQLFFYQEKLKLIILSVIIIFMLTGLLYVIHSGTTHTQLYLAMGAPYKLGDAQDKLQAETESRIAVSNPIETNTGLIALEASFFNGVSKLFFLRINWLLFLMICGSKYSQ